MNQVVTAGRDHQRHQAKLPLTCRGPAAIFGHVLQQAQAHSRDVVHARGWVAQRLELAQVLQREGPQFQASDSLLHSPQLAATLCAWSDMPQQAPRQQATPTFLVSVFSASSACCTSGSAAASSASQLACNCATSLAMTEQASAST